MNYYIFRKVDNTLLYVANSEEQYANEKKSCLMNEGGVADDYIYIISDILISAGYIPTLNEEQDVVVAVENPIVLARKQSKESADAKLMALGFTDEEIKALRG